MTFRNKQRVAAIPALVIGLFSIKEGGAVLLGLSTPTYHVLQWLVLYNVTLGFVSVIAGIGLWMQRTWSSTLAVIILSLHGVVLLTIFTLFQLGKTVAAISVRAMLLRTVVWLIIYALLMWKRDAQCGNS
jgi:uncharacterized membrane protein (DUF2068 family)